MNQLLNYVTLVEVQSFYVPNTGDGRYETDHPFIGQVGRSPSGLLAQLAASL